VRSGAVLAEMPLVLPLFFMFMFGTIIGGMGMFYYQTLSSIAREATRYATVHGTQYQTDTGSAPVTKANIYTAAMVPMASGLNLSKFSYTITYAAPTRVDWDSATHSPQYVSSTSGGTPKWAYVTVTVNYQWNALLYFGTINLQSVSEQQMYY
jgi:Flp pilus assembly protein TadG